MKILFCSPTRLDRSLGAPKVIIELAEGLTHLGCECRLVGPADIMSDLVDGRHDPVRYGVALKKYLLSQAGDYDVVDYDHEYLPYDRSEFPAQTLMVARSVLLHYHFSRIQFPQPRNFRAVAGRLVRNFLSRSQQVENRHRADRTGRQADLFLTLNSQDRDELIRVGYDGSKVVVVGLGFHPQRFAALEQANRVPTPQRRIAFVGSFDYRKGCLDFPAIVKTVNDSAPNTLFRLIGTQGLFKDSTQVLAHFPKQLQSLIQVIPKFAPDELPALLDGCSAGVFPSYIEGFGFGVLEMMAAGLPVLAYDAPGPPDMLPREWLAPRGDAIAISRLLVNLLNDPAKLKTASTEARDLAHSFTWARAARQTLDAYEAAIANLPGKSPSPHPMELAGK